jgi:hypothetical protein
MAGKFDVVVTIHTRRPPKFYTEFVPLDTGLNNRARQNLVRRRGTAMDFVTKGAVSALRHAISDVYADE